MTSYISSFRPALLALAALVLIEWYIPRNTDVYSTPFYELRYMRNEDITDGCVAAKFDLYKNRHIGFIQVGDSSGFDAVKPDIVMQHLPPGVTYVNGNCHASLSYYGYRYMAEVYLRQNKVDYLVLSVNPMALEDWKTVDTFEGIGPKVYTAYLSPWHYFLDLPTISWRYHILNYVYYGSWHLPNDPRVGFYDIDKAEKEFRETYGWDDFATMHKKMPVLNMIPCPFNSLYDHDDMKHGKPILKPHLEAFKKLADRYGAKFILMFNPTRCYATEDTQTILHQVNDFLHEHPDVYMPFPMVNVMLDQKDMGDYVHPMKSGAIIYSNAIGEKLAELLRKNSSK